VLAPDRDGVRVDIALGFADLTPYTGKGRSFGATIGRYANRIARGEFTLDGQLVRVPTSDRGNAIHGGPHPFSEVLWSAHAVEGRCGVRFSLLSPDGDNGFPGALSVHVTYVLHEGRLTVEYSATTDATTVLNLTNHAYWNLAGTGTVDAHLVRIPAAEFLPVDPTGLPTGEFRAVADTPFDLREAVPVSYRVELEDEQLARGQGFDHCYVLAATPGGSREPALAAAVLEPVSGRTLEVWTDQPGIQFFTGGSLAGTLIGKAGLPYGPRAGLALEAQGFPDAPNHPEFPSTVLQPGEEFRSVTEFRFGTD
jgi:aldose 1-epimerase